MKREFLLLGILAMSALVGGLWNLMRVGASIQSACPPFAAGVSIGNIESTLLTETSGIVASRKNPNVLWAHNDSGDSARIFAMSTTGRHLGVYHLVGATNVDWEDIATAQGYLYIGDTGDNARTRTAIAVYRVPEPSVSATQSPVTVDLTNWDKLPMQYPSTKYDAETLLADPQSGDLFVVTRDRAGEGVARVFRNPAPHTPGVTVTLELVATIPLGLPRGSTDRLPDLAIDTTHQRAYVAYPEFGKIVVVDWAARQIVKTINVTAL